MYKYIMSLYAQSEIIALTSRISFWFPGHLHQQIVPIEVPVDCLVLRRRFFWQIYGGGTVVFKRV
jgi:hypothetical protein